MIRQLRHEPSYKQLVKAWWAWLGCSGRCWCYIISLSYTPCILSHTLGINTNVISFSISPVISLQIVISAQHHIDINEIIFTEYHAVFFSKQELVHDTNHLIKSLLNHWCRYYFIITKDQKYILALIYTIIALIMKTDFIWY
jgi:hypothetical protein